MLVSEIHQVSGVKLGVAEANIKYADRNDLLVIEIDEGASVSGVFTQNAFCAAPVIVGKHHLGFGNTRFLVINSGNANACTGDQGLADAKQTCNALAKIADVRAEQVIPFSTGVIGEDLPMDRICKALPLAFSKLNAEAWREAAKAIMTTDTVAKIASQKFEFDGEEITVTGIAKGAGMICPNMATMLSYVATDAVVAQGVLDELVTRAVDSSFNRISIDGDTSTNDASILIATGHAGHEQINEARGELFEALLSALVDVHQSLAKQIVKDGEGATKFVSVIVESGTNKEECLQVAYSVANSPLVKTALFASDPNWGRIVMAIGKSDVPNLKSEKIDVWLDDVLVVKNGTRAQSYSEEAGEAVLQKNEFSIRIALHRGTETETVWTSDLSHEYIQINAEYRT